MRPGLMRDLVDVEQPSESDTTTEPAFAGVDKYRRVPCDITMVVGSETFRGRGIEPTATHVVEMQYVAGITPRMRLQVVGGLHKGKTLNITAVRPVDVTSGRAPKLGLDCREEVET